MENIITEKPVATSTKERWCEENVLQLANHFHRLEGSQYARVTRFELENSNGLNALAETITDIRIYLALEKENKKKITFCPYLLVNGKKKFDLKPIVERPKIKSDVLGSAKVPEIFKEMIWKNWDQVEMHQIDDLFHCCYHEEQKKLDDQGDRRDMEYVVRVEYFLLSSDIVDVIDKNKKQIQEITLYPGIDMNKFNHKHLISFTPVLGIKPPLTIGTMAKMGLMESNDGETFIEYSRPCPPTCP